MSTTPMNLPPSLADLEELARCALDTIPRRLKRHLGPLVIRVEEFPDEETCARLGLRSPYHLLGLPRRSPDASERHLSAALSRYHLALSWADPALLVDDRPRPSGRGAARARP